MPPDVVVFPEELVTHSEKPVFYELTIVNNNPYNMSYDIIIEGQHIEWAFPSIRNVILEPSGFEKHSLNFYPTGPDRGVFNYRITAKPNGNDIPGYADIGLTVLEDVLVKKLEAEYAKGGLNAVSVIDSIKKGELNVLFEVYDTGGNIVASAAEKIARIGETEIKEFIPLQSTLQAGEYRLRITVAGDGISGVVSEAVFRIPEVRNIIESVRKEYGFLADIYNVEITNSGNVVEDYETERSVSSNLITGFFTEPQDCRTEGSSTVCRFVLSGLGPGETRRISYRVDYWPAFIPYAVIAVIAAAIASSAVRKSTSPAIRKTYARKSGHVHSVILQIKNPFYKSLETVILRDWVTPLASVVPESFSSLKPLIRKSDAGTELVWNLGNIRPKEERVITYQIRPIVEGAGLKMPPATFRYTNKKGGLTWVSSDEIVIE